MVTNVAMEQWRPNTPVPPLSQTIMQWLIQHWPLIVFITDKFTQNQTKNKHTHKSSRISPTQCEMNGQWWARVWRYGLRLYSEKTHFQLDDKIAIPADYFRNYTKRNETKRNQSKRNHRGVPALLLLLLPLAVVGYVSLFLHSPAFS